jgi:hypothetical protein
VAGGREKASIDGGGALTFTLTPDDEHDEGADEEACAVFRTGMHKSNAQPRSTWNERDFSEEEEEEDELGEADKGQDAAADDNETVDDEDAEEEEEGEAEAEPEAGWFAAGGGTGNANTACIEGCAATENPCACAFACVVWNSYVFDALASCRRSHGKRRMCLFRRSSLSRLFAIDDPVRIHVNDNPCWKEKCLLRAAHGFDGADAARATASARTCVGGHIAAGRWKPDGGAVTLSQQQRLGKCALLLRCSLLEVLAEGHVPVALVEQSLEHLDRLHLNIRLGLGLCLCAAGSATAAPSGSSSYAFAWDICDQGLF